jgi:hypothetical protein
MTLNVESIDRIPMSIHGFRMRYHLLAVGTALSLLAVPSVAAPIISGATGTLGHKATVSISGSGFGSKSIPAPVVWDDASTKYPPCQDLGRWRAK